MLLSYAGSIFNWNIENRENSWITNSGELVQVKGVNIMGDYIEEILDSNDQEMELMSALDASDLLVGDQYEEWLVKDGILDDLEEDETYD